MWHLQPFGVRAHVPAVWAIIRSAWANLAGVVSASVNTTPVDWVRCPLAIGNYTDQVPQTRREAAGGRHTTRNNISRRRLLRQRSSVDA